MRSRARRFRAQWQVLALVASGCSGLVGDPSSASPTGDRARPQGGGAGEGPDLGADGKPLVDGGAAGRDNAGYDDMAAGQFDTPAPTTRMARLTHAQWDNTVRDLFHLDPGVTFSDGFRPDPLQSGFRFDNNGGVLEVDDALWSGYRQAATSVADYVTSDPARLAKIVPPDAGDEAARVETFIREFGLRVHRRPLQTADVDAYRSLYARGKTLYDGLPGFEGGVRLLIEAWLQSPYFVYRVEESSTAVGDVIPLDSYEVAARLSYMLWNTMPDDVLFAAAADDELSLASSVAAQAERMLEDPRAALVVRSFHHQLFEVQYFQDIAPAPAFFPNASPELGQHATTELDMFVDDQVFAREASYAELLTSNDTFVNDELAAIYGLSGTFDGTFVPATLDGTQRRGIFTQVGFLASNASSADPDPIHRGVFLAKEIACISIAAPPANTPPIPPPAMATTNRKMIEDGTEADGSTCASCHRPIINPYGFPYEAYDAVGTFRTLDNGFAVDTASAPLIDGAATPVADALELAGRLATSSDVHECYAKHWLEFGYGRPSADEDDTLIDRLADASLREKLSVKKLIVALVETEAFLTRNTEETP